MKKIIAITLIAASLFGNNFFIANAQGIVDNNIKLSHKPFWMFEEGDEDSFYVKNLKAEQAEDINIIIEDLLHSKDESLENVENTEVKNNVYSLLEGLFSGEDDVISGDDLIDNVYSSVDDVDTEIDTEDVLDGEEILDDGESDTFDNLFEGLFGDDLEAKIDDNNSVEKTVVYEKYSDTSTEITSIRKRKLQYLISQKKKRILSKKESGIKAL